MWASPMFRLADRSAWALPGFCESYPAFSAGDSPQKNWCKRTWSVAMNGKCIMYHKPMSSINVMGCMLLELVEEMQLICPGMVTIACTRINYCRLSMAGRFLSFQLCFVDLNGLSASLVVKPV